MKNNNFLIKVLFGIFAFAFFALPINAFAIDAECKFLSEELFLDQKIPTAKELAMASSSAKIDIIFQGVAYKDDLMFENFVKNIAEQAFLEVEPIKSNLHLFRFWLAPIRDKMPTRAEGINLHEEAVAACEGSSKIDLENTYVLNYINTLGQAGQPTGMAAFGSGATIKLLESKRGDYTDQLISSQSFLLLHELIGHAIAELQDEYTLKPPNEEIGEDANAKASEAKNCFVGTYEACLAESEWSDLIGQGCGKNDELDCQQEINADLNAASNDSKNLREFKDSYLEVGCYAGCRLLTEGAYRPHIQSIMNQQEQNFFGLVHQREICRKLAGITGDVTGYCTEKFGIGIMKVSTADLLQDDKNNQGGNLTVIFLGLGVLIIVIMLAYYLLVNKK